MCVIHSHSFHFCWFHHPLIVYLLFVRKSAFFIALSCTTTALPTTIVCTEANNYLLVNDFNKILLFCLLNICEHAILCSIGDATSIGVQMKSITTSNKLMYKLYPTETSKVANKLNFEPTVWMGMDGII